MNTKEIYKKFLWEFNKNDSNRTISVLPSHFILTFNTEIPRWLAEKIRDNADNVKIDDLNELLETDVKLNKVEDYDDSVTFQLPENFFRHAASYSLVDKGECKNVKIFNFPKKALGFTATLADDFSGPQFDYQETPFIITQNKMKVYFDDFKIKSVYASFYKLPIPIDMAGYEKIDGSPSTDQNTDLTDKNIDEVITRVVSKLSAQDQSAERFQFAKERIISEP
jgi:hypothetical protein